MKHLFSLLSCFLISIVILQQRISYSELGGGKPLKVTNWDALGYYMYLPAIVIYKDVKDLKWFPAIDSQYAVSGGYFYQAGKVENGEGNYVFKYLGGVALLQTPFFLAAHWIAPSLGYPADGFSKPYQYAAAFASIIYCILSIFLLRRILRRFFKDQAVAIALLLLCLATNFLQYAAIDTAMSHAYIFPLYVAVLYTTIKWHERPTILWAALTGYIIGLATISRPTEAVMLFIPLFWDTQNKDAAEAKWTLVKQHRSHIYIAAIFGLLGILPQLIYWKIATNSFIYDVGSAWHFLTPHLRVLFGWEKGWFIYTPVTIFFIAGMFFIKQYPFRKSVLWFCLLNIYIIISWADWRYGGSYSTRALVQSYPVFALPLAACIERINVTKWRWAFYPLGIYFIGVNIFQVWQYNKTILHYDHMNRRYYSHIYLNPNPTPLDMSLLDTDEMLNSEKGYQKKTLVAINDIPLKFSNTSSPLLEIAIPDTKSSQSSWLKIESSLQTNDLWESYLHAELRSGNSIKHTRIRLYNATIQSAGSNSYAFYIKVPENFRHNTLKIYLTAIANFEGKIENLVVTNLITKT